MKKLKYLICVVLAACMIALSLTAFVGCGGDEEEDTLEQKIVKVWLHKSESEDEGKVYKAIAEAFNDEHLTTSTGRKIKMRLEFKNSSTALSSAINAEVLAGSLPDVVAVDAPNVAAYANSKILTDITQYISAESRADYVDSVIEQGTYNGKLYALSGADSPTGLYYNKKLLKEVGYTDGDFGTVENPWSWAELMEAMTRLKTAGKSYKIKLNFGFGGEEGSIYFYAPLVYSAGGSFVGADGKTAGALNSDASVKGLQQIERFYTAGDWVYSGTNEDVFAQGGVAFEVYGTWHVSKIAKNYKSFVNDYGVMPMPVYSDESGNKGTPSAGCGSWGFGVTPNSKDKEAAAIVVEYLTNAFSSELLYDSIGTFPTHKSSLHSEQFNSGALKTFADIMTEIAQPRPIAVNYPKISEAYASILEYIETSYGTTGYNLKNYISNRCVSIDAGK